MAKIQIESYIEAVAWPAGGFKHENWARKIVAKTILIFSRFVKVTSSIIIQFFRGDNGYKIANDLLEG
jgi:hypothetical protein